MRILGLSGSLRADSSNTRLLRAAFRVAPAGVSGTIYEGIDRLPHFSPDLESGPLPTAVSELRASVQEADAVLICSPEYAGGIPGAFKNALDWLVGCMAMVDKPTAAINLSPWSTHAQGSLLLVLSMLSARVVRESCIELPLRGLKLTAEELATHPEFGPPLAQALAALLRVASAPAEREPVEV